MSDADRRVPTAADVERWGKRWWHRDDWGNEFCEFIMIADGKPLTIDWRPLDHPDIGTWLGPVNPEPLPWPEGGR